MPECPGCGKKHEVILSKNNFFDMGYNMAKGREGTNWMTLYEADIDELLDSHPDLLKLFLNYTENHGFINEILDDYANEWTETCQWDYEVGIEIRNRIEAKNDREYDNHSEEDVSEFFDKKEEWIMGYTKYMTELLKKRANKLKKK